MKRMFVILIIVAVALAAIFYKGALFAPPEIGRTQAIENVKNLPQVAEFVKLLEEKGKAAHFDAEKTESGNWSVHVYEIVEDADGGASHTATFGWYEVSKKTGEVKDIMSL